MKPEHSAQQRETRLLVELHLAGDEAAEVAHRPEDWDRGLLHTGYSRFRQAR